MKQSITLPSPAKLNLFLHITGQRADGYHSLQTLFQLLDFGDELEFRIRDDSRLRLTPELEGVPQNDNLIIKAARQLQQHSKCVLGVDIQLRKRLPMGGGIGGGSSNAATTLLALNQLWRLNYSLTQLADIGRQLGADVPVFVRGQTAWAEGIGEQLTTVDMPTLWYLVMTPQCHVSTAEIFSHKELTRDTAIIKVAAFLKTGGKNDCQSLVRNLYPEVDQALDWLSQFGHAQLTGTGACVFASFESKTAAEAALAQAPDDLSGFIAKGVNQSPLHTALCLQHNSIDTTGV